MLKKLVYLLALTLLASSLLACKDETTKLNLSAQPSPTNQTSPQPGSQPPMEVVAPAPPEFKETFSGAIDGKHAIRMELERKGAELTGSYYYERPGAFNAAMRTLELKGHIDADGNATLTETTYNPETGARRKTGEFKGKLESVMANGSSLRFTGVWIGGKDKREAPFSARQIDYDLGGLKLDEKRQEIANKQLRYEIETALPRLTGADSVRVEKFNQAVASFVSARTGGFKKSVDEMAREAPIAAKQDEKSSPPPNSLDVSYQVVAANKDFISILFFFFEYTGGAHPNTTTSSFNYDLNRNSVIKLDDLFIPNSNYLQLISDYSIKELKKLDTVSYAEEGAGPKLENFHSWNITPAGLKITFDPYQVGAYAAGEHEVVVPYSVLKSVIKPDGLLAQFVK
jgi:hypothetical protein